MQLDCYCADWGSPPAPCLHVARLCTGWGGLALPWQKAGLWDCAHPLLAVLLSLPPPSPCPSDFRTVVETAATARKSPPGCRAQLVLQPRGPPCLSGCPAEEPPSLKDKVAAAPQGGFVYSFTHPYLRTVRTAPGLAAALGSGRGASGWGQALVPETDLDASESAAWDCAAAARRLLLPSRAQGGRERLRRRGPRPGWSSSADTFHGAEAALQVWCIFIYVGLYISHVGF